MDELKPLGCPICGTQPIVSQLTDKVWIAKCGAVSVLHDVNAMSWTSAADCIANWNRRTPDGGK